ncbi:MAG: SAM-dependent methyltransferase ['Waltheria sp.' little leaf phytoplasma]|nr:SAM-dependent methyltransferase ['Waltheria sp.' little leaf phytoplasma]
MNRILFIVSLIKNYNTVADIGTDHGLVLIKRRHHIIPPSLHLHLHNKES